MNIQDWSDEYLQAKVAVLVGQYHSADNAPNCTSCADVYQCEKELAHRGWAREQVRAETGQQS